MVRSTRQLIQAVNTLRGNLRSNWHVRTDNSAVDIDEIRCPIILAGPIGLFYVSEDGAVIEVPPLSPVAVGSGERFAIGAAWAVLPASAMCPVRVGLAAAAAFDPYTGCEIDIETVQMVLSRSQQMSTNSTVASL